MQSYQYLAEECRCEVATLDGYAAEKTFLVRFLQNVFFNRLLTYQPCSRAQVQKQLEINHSTKP